MTAPVIRQDSFWDRPNLRRVETPAARNTDDFTSHLVAKNQTISGRRHAHMAMVVDAVRRQPGLTSAEIALACGLERHEAARRLPEALTAGAVVKGPARKCSTSDITVMTWWPA